MMKKATCLLILILLPLFITGCGKERRDKTKDEVIPVRVMKAELKNLKKALEYVGTIKGQDEAMVYPKISGKIIEKVREDGNFVNKGDIIAYIDRDEVGFKFEKAPVESPLKGIVGRVYVDIGSNVNPETPIALVSDMNRAEVHIDVPEKYLPRISIGQQAEIMVDSYPQILFTGKVTQISPVLDVQTRTAPIQILIENKDYLLQSGMFARVRLIIQENGSSPVILKEAIIGRDPNTYVYVIENKKAHLRKITLGIREGPYFEVTDGLKKEDLVVIMGQQRLRDGSLVAAEE